MWFSVSLVILSAAPAPLRVRPLSVGVVYVLPSKNSAVYELQLVFPASATLKAATGSLSLPKDTAPVALEGELVLFDARGPLARLPAQAGALRLWCENDGGSQLRPELRVSIQASKLKRALAPLERVQNVAAFVVLMPQKSAKPKGMSWRATDAERVLDGDFDGDGKPEAVVYGVPDDARNCDGAPKNHLGVVLAAGDEWDALRCCGR